MVEEKRVVEGEWWRERKGVGKLIVSVYEDDYAKLLLLGGAEARVGVEENGILAV